MNTTASSTVEGFEVIIRYRGAKFDRVASPATDSAALAILKKDLAHLRVHSPSQKNVQRISGSFVFQWPGLTPNNKDSLHTRWIKLCSDDPEVRKLRETLSIDSITLSQDGIVICSTEPVHAQVSQEGPSGSFARRLRSASRRIPTMQSPSPKNTGPFIAGPSSQPPPPPSLSPPPLPLVPPNLRKFPSSALRSDRPSPYPRWMSNLDDKLGSVTQAHTPTSLRSAHTPPANISVPVSPQADLVCRPATPRDATNTTAAFNPPLTRGNTPRSSSVHTLTPPLPAPVAAFAPEPEVAAVPASPGPGPPGESGEVTPRPPSPASGSVNGGPDPDPGPRTSPDLGSSRAPGPPPAAPLATTPSVTVPVRTYTPTVPVPRVNSMSVSGNGDAPRLRERDISRLMRELWDTRRQQTALQAREKVILDDLGRFGVRPENTNTNSKSTNEAVREDLARLEAELRAERERRVRAEQALNDVERECRAPFVVPALFQAFLSISELSR